MKAHSYYPKLLVLLALSFLISCQSEKKQSIQEINVRLSKDPLKINPVFNPSSSAREVFQYIFAPLADFHPETQELIPILIDEIPEKQLIQEGPFKGDDLYKVNIRQEAKWSDGSDITADDFVFTYKSIMLPQSNTLAWRSYLDCIKNIKTDLNNPKYIEIIVEDEYMLGKEAVLTMYILQKSKYDPLDIMSKTKFEDFEKDTEWMESDSQFIQFAKAFNSPTFSRDSVNNTGPYTLESWVTNQSIVLKRKENYWGASDVENPFLQAGSERMIFKIIPDENTAINALKDGQLDVLSLKSSRNFLELSQDTLMLENFNFFSPQQYSYYYIAMNNRKPGLSDKKVRKALAHALEVNSIINTVDQGFGTRTVGHFNPAKSYYANNIEANAYDITKSNKLLSEAGWADTNDNGIKDKIIDGQLTELEFDIIISGSQLTEGIAVLFKESLKDIGVSLNIVRKKYSIMRKEDIATRSFDMAAMAVTQDVAPDDPFPRWHSDSDIPGGNNFVGYNSSEADELIESIREESDQTVRKERYIELQEQMHEDQPVIFLYSPKLKIVINNSYESSASSRRPGYMANTFYLKSGQ